MYLCRTYLIGRQTFTPLPLMFGDDVVIADVCQITEDPLPWLERVVVLAVAVDFTVVHSSSMDSSCAYQLAGGYNPQLNLQHRRLVLATVKQSTKIIINWLVHVYWKGVHDARNIRFEVHTMIEIVQPIWPFDFVHIVRQACHHSTEDARVKLL